MVKTQQNLLESETTLLENLNQYKWLISKEAYEYLESLLKLEISAFNPEFSDTNREILRRIDLYKKIAIFNIRNRTKNLLSNNSEGILIDTVERYDHPVEFNIFGKLDDRNFDCFRFNISEENPLYIGDAIINSSAINATLRSQEMQRLKNLHNIKTSQDNPLAMHDGITRLQDENGSSWEIKHKYELDRIKKEYDNLAMFTLDDRTKELIAAKNYLAELILQDMNLKDSDFTTTYGDGMKRNLVRKYPDMSIKHNITNL